MSRKLRALPHEDHVDPSLAARMGSGWIILILAFSVSVAGCTDAADGTGAGGGGNETAASGAGAPSSGASMSGTTTSSGGTTSSAGGSSGTGAGGGAPLPVDECESPEPEWIFCSGFEEGNKDIWDDYDGNPDQNNLLLEDSGPFGNTGNHVMRLRVDPGRGGSDLVKVLPSDHDRLYARWYIRYEPGFDFDAPNHGGGLFAGSRDLLGQSGNQPSGDDWYTGWVDYDSSLHVPFIYSYYPGMYMDCTDPQGSCWGDHFPCMVDDGQTYCTNPAHQETTMPPTLQAGQWYCVELMLDGGAPTPSAAGASGALNLSVDGVPYGPWEGLWMRSAAELKINILWLSLFHHDEHSVEGVFYDHVVVSTAPIGCFAD